MSTIKIQINDGKSVEKLIESDDNLKIEIKKAILDGFAKRYIKTVATDEAIQQLRKSIIDELHATDYFGLLDKTPAHQLLLSDTMKKLIKDRVNDTIACLITDEVFKIESKLIDRINDRVNDIIALYGEEKINELIKLFIGRKLSEIIKKNI